MMHPNPAPGFTLFRFSSTFPRRAFLRSGLAAAAAIASTPTQLSRPVMATVSIQSTGSTTMYDPEETGILRREHKDALWHVFSYIGSRWQTTPFNAVTRTAFTRVLDLKTSRTPSYYMEYISAVQLLDKLALQTGSISSAIAGLFENGDHDDSQQQHAYTYVVSEFIMLQVARGGFRKWGYLNYPGYTGGSFNNPYRVWGA